MLFIISCLVSLAHSLVTGRLICVDESPESERAFFTLLWDLAQPDRHDVILICNGKFCWYVGFIIVTLKKQPFCNFFCGCGDGASDLLKMECRHGTVAGRGTQCWWCVLVVWVCFGEWFAWWVYKFSQCLQEVTEGESKVIDEYKHKIDAQKQKVLW